MKRSLSLFLCVLFTSPLFAQTSFPNTLSVGFVDAKGMYRISTDFGIEQWEDGKRTTHRYQTWHLLCSPETYGARLPFDTWCALERIVIDGDLTDKGTKIITGHNHYIGEDTFKVTNVDWPAGKLDFTITFTDGQTADAALRFKRNGSSLYLDSFKAIGIARGFLSDTISAVEYRIPEYSYLLNVQMEMRGLKTEDQKVRDDFENSLSEKDLSIFKAAGDLFGSRAIIDSEMKKIIPDADKIEKGERKMTSLEAEKIVNLMFSGAMNWIPRSGMSPDGQVKTRAFFGTAKSMTLSNMLKDLEKK